MIESRGIPTVVVGLVRLHMEKTRNPRGLFVPFELGRPFGEPGDAAFQRRVIVAALKLLDHSDGPVVLEDFAEDAPGQKEDQGWRPPAWTGRVSIPAVQDAGPWQKALADELALVAPAYAAARQARGGRSTVGLSGLDPSQWASYAAHFLTGALPAPPPSFKSPALGLRYLADDLKAYYMEAAQAQGGRPPGRQLSRWLYGETVAGRLLIQLRAASLDSADNGFKTVGGRFLVPGAFVPKG